MIDNNENQTIEQSEISSTNSDIALSKNDNKKRTLFFIIVNIIVVFGIVGAVFFSIQFSSTDERVDAKNNSKFYNLSNEFIVMYDSLYEKDKINVDIDPNASFEDQSADYNNTIAYINDFDIAAQDIKDYILNCENDLVITDEEVKILEEKVNAFKVKVEAV